MRSRSNKKTKADRWSSRAVIVPPISRPPMKTKQKREMMNDEIIAVTGATGQQGGAVARKLLADGWKVRALTRDVGKPAAQELKVLGAEIVPGDMEDRAQLDAAFQGAY